MTRSVVYVTTQAPFIYDYNSLDRYFDEGYVYEIIPSGNLILKILSNMYLTSPTGPRILYNTRSECTNFCNHLQPDLTVLTRIVLIIKIFWTGSYNLIWSRSYSHDTQYNMD